MLVHVHSVEFLYRKVMLLDVDYSMPVIYVNNLFCMVDSAQLVNS
jgi:hypothetical protein